MQRTNYISLAVVATAFTLMGALAVGQPAAAKAPSSDTASWSLEIEQAPIPAESGDLLCGLSLSDVAGIVDHYDFNPDMQGLADALETPFNCEAYGGLCEVLEPTYAHAHVCAVWKELREAETLADLIKRAMDRLQNWRPPCDVDQAACEQLCSPYDVLECGATRDQNGVCRPVAMCDVLPMPIHYFDFINPN